MIDERVAKLEQSQARTEERLERIEDDVSKIDNGINTLLERSARNGEALTWKGIAATLLVTGSVIGMLATFTWWMIAASPAVNQLAERVTDLDHDKRGRVRVLEKRLDRLDGWEPRVSRK